MFGALFAAPCVAEAATCTWTGLAADNKWSSAGNWDGCGGAHPTPQAGDSLVFPAGTPRATPLNDLVDLIVAGVQITGAPAPGGRYAIYGNALRLAGELQFNAPPNVGPADGPVLYAPLVLDGASVISNLGTGPAFLEAIDLNGASLTFAPDTTHTALGSPAGGTTLAAGATLIMEGQAESADPLTLDGGTLTGDGLNYEYTEMKWNGPVTVTSSPETIVCPVNPGLVPVTAARPDLSSAAVRLARSPSAAAERWSLSEGSLTPCRPATSR